MVPYLCTLHPDYSVLNHALRILCTSRSDVWRGKVGSLDINEVLAQSCGAMGAGR